MRNEFTKAEKFELFLNRDGAMTASRLIVGATLGAAIASGGWMYGALAAAGTLAFNAYALETTRVYRHKVLLDLYADEVGALVGKSPSQVTPEDLELAAKPKEQGGHGVIVLQKALELFKEKRTFGVSMQALTTALVATALFVLESVTQTQNLAVGFVAGGAGVFYNELYKAVESVGSIMTGHDDKHTVTRDIRAMAEQVLQGGMISSTRVLGVFVDADPALAQQIRTKFGDEYEDLPIATKRRLVQALDSAYNLYKLTDDVNTGCVQVTELGFLAYGQHSPIGRCKEPVPVFAGGVEGKAEFSKDAAIAARTATARAERDSIAEHIPAGPEDGPVGRISRFSPDSLFADRVRDERLFPNASLRNSIF